MTQETKVGLFAFTGVVLLGITVYMLGSFSFTKGYPVNVKFEDVSGLPKKSNVRLNGVEIGKVKEIRIEESGVVVELSIKENTEIYKDSAFKISSTSIIGSKYLRIDQGSPKSGVIQPGDYVNGLNELSMEDRLSKTMESLDSLLVSVDNRGRLGQDLSYTMNNLRELTTNLNELVASMKPYITDSVQDISGITRQTNELIARTDRIMDALEGKDGLIGSLINDPDMKQSVSVSLANLKDVTEDAKELLGKSRKFRMFWTFDARYDTTAELFATDLGLNILSSNGYSYYRLGIANMGNKDNTLKEKDYYDPNLLDVRLGFYNNRFDVSMGYIRGAGGVELAVVPFYGMDILDRLTLRGTATDLARDRVINGRRFDRGNITLEADFKINKFIVIGGGVADILEVSHPYAKMGVKLEDKDIVSFFGLAGLASAK